MGIYCKFVQKIMKIVVLNKKDHNISIISVQSFILEAYDDVANYLKHHCGFNLNEISWFIDKDITIFPERDNDSYHCDDGNAPDPKWVKDSLKRIKDHVDIINKKPWLKVSHLFFYKDEYGNTNEAIFGDKKRNTINMTFYDGFAIEDTGNNGKKPLFALYPTQYYISENEELYNWLMDNTCSQILLPFDVAMIYSKLFTFNEIQDKLDCF